MKLNRDSLQRMFGSAGGSGGGGSNMSSTQIAAMFAGIATEGWVRENFLSIEFFGRLFKAYAPAETQGDPDVEVEPNDLETTITNIKAMFGFWTEQYISALGQGSGGSGGAMALSDLVDVLLSNPTQGQTLVYDGNGHWVNGNATAGTVTSVGMTVPTGFSVNPAAITSSGIFAITFANGYSLPTNAKQSNWDTAYGWGNHATAGYASQQSVNVIAGYFDNNGNAKSALKLTTISKTAWGKTYWTSGGVPTNISGDMSDVGNIQCGSGKRIYGNGNLYIGDSGNAYYVMFSDMCSQDGTNYWLIRQNGNATFANVLSNGYVTALSDIRLKNVIGRFSLKPEAIAYASIIEFTWKEGDTKTKHVGGIAQEWQEILPDAVVEDEGGRLAMDYGAISYVSVVSLARRVVAQQKTIDEQQKTIRELKAANDKLEKRLARLERLFAITDEEGEE